VGAILTAYAVAQFVSAPVLGSLSDRYGRRRILLLSLTGSAISLTLAGVAFSLFVLLLARAVAGGFGGAISVGQAYAVDLTAAKDRTRALGMIGAAIGLGFVFGPAIGAGLAALGVGFGGTCFVAAAIAVVNLGLGLRLLPDNPVRPAIGAHAAGDHTARSGLRAESKAEVGAPAPSAKGRRAPRKPFVLAERSHRGRPFALGDPLSVRIRRVAQLALHSLREAPLARLSHLAAALHLRSLRPILLSGFAATFAFAGMETTFALLGREKYGLGPAGFGAVFAGVGIIMALVQGGLVGRLTDRYGDRGVAVAGAVLLGVGLLTIPFAPAWLGYLALGLVGAGQGLLTTTTAALIAVRGGHRVGGSLGIGQSASAAARAVGPLVAGIAFDLGPALPYVLGAALALGAAVLLARSDGTAIAPVPVATFTIETEPTLTHPAS
jgi:MFS family permease